MTHNDRRICFKSASPLRQSTPPSTTLPQVWNLREGCDREIDALVYGLYGLTEDETRVVEGLDH